MRPRILTAMGLARIREVFMQKRDAHQRYVDEVAQLPTVEQLASECRCSVALVRLIGAGHRYAMESVETAGAGDES